MVKLNVRDRESIQEAVRRFRKLVERSGIKKEMRRREYYEKPSERKQRALRKSIKRAEQLALGLPPRKGPPGSAPPGKGPPQRPMGGRTAGGSCGAIGGVGAGADGARGRREILGG